MSLSGFLLVLAAAFCHAAWNYAVKRIDGGPELVWLFSFVSVVIYLPVAIVVVWLEPPSFGLLGAAFIAGSAALHLGYFLLLQQGYRHGDLSLVYPTARATGPLLATSFAIVFLGEHWTPQILFGAVTIVVGVLFLTGGPRGGGSTRSTSSLAFGVGAGTLIGSYTVWDAYAVSVLAVTPLLLDYFSSMGRAVLLAPHARRQRGRVAAHWRDHRGAVLVIAVFNPLAYILVLYALTFTSVVYVAPVREVSVLLSVLAGALLLGEGDLPRRLVWAAVILGGVAVLATG